MQHGVQRPPACPATDVEIANLRIEPVTPRAGFAIGGKVIRNGECGPGTCALFRTTGLCSEQWHEQQG
jgi:hypothetical protein